MLPTRTFLATAAIAGGLLASPPAAAGPPQRIPEPPPPVPRAQRSECLFADRVGFTSRGRTAVLAVRRRSLHSCIDLLPVPSYASRHERVRRSPWRAGSAR